MCSRHTHSHNLQHPILQSLAPITRIPLNYSSLLSDLSHSTSSDDSHSSASSSVKVMILLISSSMRPERGRPCSLRMSFHLATVRFHNLLLYVLALLVLSNCSLLSFSNSYPAGSGMCAHLVDLSGNWYKSIASEMCPDNIFRPYFFLCNLGLGKDSVYR